MATDDARSHGLVSDDRLAVTAGVVAVVVALLHLFHPTHGLGRLVTLLVADPLLLRFDPRPLAFVLSAGALLAGTLAVSQGAPRRPAALLGMALAATYVLGYVAWHFTGHGGFLPGRDPLYHGLTPLENVVVHVTGDLWAAASKTAELAMFVLLGVLYRRESG